MNDLISRQAAIKALRKLHICKPMGNNGYAYDMALDEVDNVIKNLSPAKPEIPEIIRCKDCKHRGEKPIADGRYWCERHGTFMYYCSDAKRRTDE